MKAHVFEPRRWPDILPCWLQPKFNGVRALYQAGHFQSADELPWNDGVLAHLVEPLLGMFPEPNIILDGELYVHGWSLQRINGAVQIARTAPREDTHEVCFYVFDVVNFQASFIDRIQMPFERIRSLNRKYPKVQVATTVQVPADNRAWADKFYAETVAEGFEGIMYRLGVCPYTRPSMGRGISDKNNRTFHLLKRKSWQDDEFVCVGIQEGEGKRAGMVGAFVCKTPEGKTFTVGSGLSESEATYYLANPPTHQLIKVKFLCLSEDGIPLNPTVMCVM